MYLFILWLNNFFRPHVLITLFDGFCLTPTSILLAVSMASPLSSGIEGKVSLIPSENPDLKWRRPF